MLSGQRLGETYCDLQTIGSDFRNDAELDDGVDDEAGRPKWMDVDDRGAMLRFFRGLIVVS